MKQQIHDIIRSQWPNRHSADEHARARARNLIQVHVALARKLALSADGESPKHTTANIIAPLYIPFHHAA